MKQILVINAQNKNQGGKYFFTKQYMLIFLFNMPLPAWYGSCFYHYLDRINQKIFFENERSWKLSVYVCYVPVRHDSNQRDGWEYRNLALQKTDNYLATSLCVLTQYDDVVHRKTQLVKSFDVLNLIKYTKCLEFMYYNNQLRFAYFRIST